MDSIEAVARRALAEGLADAPTDYVDEGVAMTVASHEEWRAVFVLILQPSGEWQAELPLFRAEPARRLEALSQGGTYGGGWNGLFSIAPADFHGTALITLLSAGQDMDDAHGTPCFVRGWAGFARPNVASVRAIGSRHTTMAPVSRIGNAFAVITLDENPVELQALDASGAVLETERHD